MPESRISNEAAEVRAVVEGYFTSYLGAKAEGIASAFHPSVHLLSVDEGRLDRTDLPAWLTGLRARAEKGDIRQATREILSLDITGEAAAVKARLQFTEFAFVDYLSLLKIAGVWQIVGKIYVKQPIGGES